MEFLEGVLVGGFTVFIIGLKIIDNIYKKQNKSK